MSDKPAFTRREFVHSSLAVVSTAATIPAFLHRSALAVSSPTDLPATTSRPGVPEDRILVVVQLSGGNDGLNTIVPYGDPDYYDARPVLSIRDDQILKLASATGVGLNEALADVNHMLDDSLAAIVQGVGYPNPNRSHFASMDIWHTCLVRGRGGKGWLGRALDQISPEQNSAMIAIGKNAPLAGIGDRTLPVSFKNANLFRWSGTDLNEMLAKQYDQINRAGVLDPMADADDQAVFVQRTALDAQLVSDRVRTAVATSPVTPFPNSKLANQLRMVAAMIRAEMPTRIYYVGLDGFDTHANQTGRHTNLLRQFATAMRGFYKELKALGQDKRVLAIAFSEFGRRVRENASRGTDHGTAGPMFLFGPMVQPGLHGKHPSLTNLDNGDLIYNTDFRSVYATVLDSWLKADSRKVLGRTMKHAAVLNPKSVA